MYEAVTRDIKVTASPSFLADQSNPDKQQYFWSYTIEIANLSSTSVQLMSRHWKITDATGRLQEVKGPGVVGQQPVIQPGESFRYTSGCPLETPEGIMVGTYAMRGSDGEAFTVAIPAFSLDSGLVRRTLN